MIKAEFYKKDGIITGYKIGGHAFFDVAGKDIVCAAVSSLSTAISNQVQLTDEPGNQSDDGEIFIEVQNIAESEWNNALLAAFLNGLLDIEDGYPNNLKVVINDGL